MLRRAKLHSLILSRRSIGEADRLLTLFTRPYGLMRVVAKGVRNIPSRRGGYLEPLTHVLALVSGKDSSHYLAGVEPVDDFLELNNNRAAQIHAQVLAYVVMNLFEADEQQEQLFDALNHAFSVLPDLPPAKQHLLESAVTLFAIERAGLQPQLNRCHICSTTNPQDPVILDVNAGGWHCLACHNSLAGTRLSLTPRLLKATRWLLANPQQALRLKVTSDESQQLVHALRFYIDGIIEKPVLSNPNFLLNPILHGQT